VQRQPCWCDGVAAVRHCCCRRCPRRSAMSCGALRNGKIDSTGDQRRGCSAEYSARLQPALFCSALLCCVLCYLLRVPFRRIPTSFPLAHARMHACTRSRCVPCYSGDPPPPFDDIDGNIDSVDVAPRVSISLSLSLSLSAPGSAACSRGTRALLALVT
jgi:hypothetical protein